MSLMAKQGTTPATPQAAPATGQPAHLVALMESLADPTRLRLLRLLEQQELGVAELCDVLQLPQSTVSRHLKTLSDQGWLHSRRQGTTHLYRMILDEIDQLGRRLWLLSRDHTDHWATAEQDQLRLARLLREKQEGAAAFFAGAAAEWDAMRTSLYGQYFTLAALVSLLPGELVVADLGCGTGQIASLLAPRVKQVIAVDNSPAMLKAARGRTADLNNVDLRRGEIDALPIDDGSVDAALMILVLTYLPDPPAALREAARILRPGGRLVVIDLLPHDRDDFRRQMNQLHKGFGAAAVESMMHEAGLSRVTFGSLPPDPDTRGPALFLAGAQRASH